MRRPTRRFWDQLDLTRDALLTEFAGDGVIRVEWEVGFVPPFRVVAWLGTATDEERDAIETGDPLDRRVRATFANSDFDPDDLGEVTATTQSQETVDRDYESSWFYALR